MLRIKEMTIFSISLETLDKSPRALAKIRAGNSSCHSAPVVRAFKVYKPVPININYSQTKQRLKQSRLKSVYRSIFLFSEDVPKAFLRCQLQQVPVLLFQIEFKISIATSA